MRIVIESFYFAKTVPTFPQMKSQCIRDYLFLTSSATSSHSKLCAATKITMVSIRIRLQLLHALMRRSGTGSLNVLFLGKRSDYTHTVKREVNFN